MQTRWRITYKSVAQHLLFWAALMLYQAISYGWEYTDEFTFKLAPALLTAGIPVTILLTYINLYLLMPAYYYHQQYIRYAIAIIVLLLAGGVLVRYLTYEFVIPWERLHNPERYRQENKNFWIPVRILRVSLEPYPIIALTMLLKLMNNAYHSQKDLRELEKEKFSAEMRLLKAQINPHFFFNTLNSLYGLALKGSEKTARVVLRLSELMHYMLYEARADKVLLKDEISHLENYIGIEQMRFADRLDISFEYSGDISGKMIAPLLLLPFIENAFKHGLTDQTGWITITLKVISDRLYLKVENSNSPEPKKSSHGLGLENVKRRLELSYAGKYDLHLIEKKEVFQADLKLDL